MIDTRSIRSAFPILARMIHGEPLVYLDNAATTQKPTVVLERIQQFYTQTNGNIHRGVHTLSEQASGFYENARRRVAEFINARIPEEVVFTRGATESINLVAASFANGILREGDEIILTEMEHHSNIVPWHMACERTGAVIKVLPVGENGMLRLDRLPELISDRTRIVGVTNVSHVLGTKNDVAEVVRIAHSRDVPVLVDGAQAVQHMAVDVREMDCDFFVFSGHKIFAETGIGVLYGKEKWLERLPPYQGGGAMISTVEMHRTTYARPPLKFEAGTGNFVAAASLATALDYVESVGLERIAAHERDLLSHAERRLRELEGVVICGRPEERCGLISFNVDGVHPLDAALMLDKMGFAVRTGLLCAEPLMRALGIGGAIRASFALYNTREEVDRLIDALDRVRCVLRD